MLQLFLGFVIKKVPGGTTTCAVSETVATWGKSPIKNEAIPKQESAEELHKANY